MLKKNNNSLLTPESKRVWPSSKLLAHNLEHTHERFSIFQKDY